LAGHDPRVTVSLYTADPELDPFSIEAISQANPALGDFQNEEEVLAMAEDARRMPSREADYRNLILNQRVERASPFIAKALWKTCGAAPIESFAGKRVWGALDLSSVNDLTSLTLIAEEKGVWQVHCYFWLPEVGLVERSRLDRVQYDVWAREGYIQLTPGKSVEYEYVSNEIYDILHGLNVAKIAFDRWGWRHLKPWMKKAGFDDIALGEGTTDEEKARAIFVEMGQGYQSMSPALRATESAILNGKIAHGNHPVLSMCAANSVVTKDPAGNRKLDKAKSRGRIDGMQTLTMAMGVAESSPVERPKEYQMLFV